MFSLRALCQYFARHDASKLDDGGAIIAERVFSELRTPLQQGLAVAQVAMAFQQGRLVLARLFDDTQLVEALRLFDGKAVPSVSPVIGAPTVVLHIGECKNRG